MKKRILALVLALASVAGLSAATSVSPVATDAAPSVDDVLKGHAWK